jgi:hypothetical protein
MKIKLLLQNGSKFRYIVKNSDKSFEEAQPIFDQLIESEGFQYLFISDNGKCYINDVNDNNKLIQVVSDCKYAMPNCFNYKDTSNENPNIDESDKYFFGKKISFIGDLHFPLNDFDSIDKFFNHLFNYCGIYQNKFDELSFNNNFDFETMLKNSHLKQDEIDFLQAQIDYIMEIMFENQNELKHIKTYGYLRQQATNGVAIFLNSYVDNKSSDVSYEDYENDDIQNLLNNI